jgi:hypothetical protein
LNRFAIEAIHRNNTFTRIAASAGEKLNDRRMQDEGIGSRFRMIIRLLTHRRVSWAVIFSVTCCGCAFADDNWHLALYGAVMLDGNLVDMSILYTGFENSYLWVAALGKKVASYCEKIDFEIEGQIVKHSGFQRHWEVNGLVAARWLPFPWDNYLDTSFAGGAGLSMASEIPKLEEERNGEGQTEPLLVYLMLELAFSLPKTSNWSLITRIHHRSGAFGLFNGVTGSSNAWAFGIKFRF